MSRAGAGTEGKESRTEVLTKERERTDISQHDLCQLQFTMPHNPSDHWQKRLNAVTSALSEERIAAQEWRTVAEVRLQLMRGLDHALTQVLERASQMEQVLNVGAPTVAVKEPPPGASAEEVARFSRTKLRAIVTFTKNLALEAARAEATISDVFAIAQSAATTNRPACDTSKSTLAEELAGEDWFEGWDGGPDDVVFDSSSSIEASYQEESEDEPNATSRSSSPAPNSEHRALAVIGKGPTSNSVGQFLLE